MKTHKDLAVWQKSIEFVSSVYKETKSFPKEEVFGITSQLRRETVSIASNISEGAARSSEKEFSHFLSYAIGSVSEVETLLLISFNLNYIEKAEHSALQSGVIELRKMLFGLKKSVDGK